MLFIYIYINRSDLSFSPIGNIYIYIYNESYIETADILHTLVTI